MLRTRLNTLLAILAAALWVAACTTPASARIASECGPQMGAAQSCTNWYSGGN